MPLRRRSRDAKPDQDRCANAARAMSRAERVTSQFVGSLRQYLQEVRTHSNAAMPAPYFILDINPELENSVGISETLWSLQMIETIEIVLWSAALATWILLFICLVANGVKTLSSRFSRRMKTGSRSEVPDVHRTTTP